MQQSSPFVKRKKPVLTKKKVSDSLFFYGLIAIPIFMLAFNTIAINGNSLLLAFREFDTATGKTSFAFFDNFKAVIYAVGTDDVMQTAVKNSLILYAVAVVVTSVIPILFSYYVYKKLLFHNFFKVILFLPSIISPIITVTIYKYVVENLLVDVLNNLFGMEVFGFMSNPKTMFGTVLFYYLWMSFGGGLLIQLGAMNSVDHEVAEASYIDGVGFFGELWHVVLPKTYQVISIGFITGIISIFTNDMGLYAFKGTSADPRVYTLGYYFQVQTINGELSDYPYLAAWGLIATAISVPLTFLARYLIYNFGPQEE